MARMRCCFIVLWGIFGCTNLTLSEEPTDAVNVGQIDKGWVHGPRGEKGSRGHRGHTGHHGPKGPKGPRGMHGDTGSTGHTGSTGKKGHHGPTGPRGPTGSTGPTGNTGPTGAIGSSGLAGGTGATGPLGSTGSTGPIGANLLSSAQISLLALPEVSSGTGSAPFAVPLGNFITDDSTVFTSDTNAIKVLSSGYYSIFFFVQALYDTPSSPIDTPFTGSITVNSTPVWNANIVPYSPQGGIYTAPSHTLHIAGLLRHFEEFVVLLNANDSIGLHTGPLLTGTTVVPYYFSPLTTSLPGVGLKNGISAIVIVKKLSSTV